MKLTSMMYMYFILSKYINSEILNIQFLYFLNALRQIWLNEEKKKHSHVTFKKKKIKLSACQLLLHVHHGVVLGVKHMRVITRRGERGNWRKEFFVRVHFVDILLCVAGCILRVHFRIRRINSVVWCSVSMKFYQKNTHTSLQFNLIFKGKRLQEFQFNLLKMVRNSILSSLFSYHSLAELLPKNTERHQQVD